MRKRMYLWWLFALALFLLPLSEAKAQKKVDLIGEEVLYFTLPSNQDRAINYLSEYYGKHHLIMTFFPAAFTPV